LKTLVIRITSGKNHSKEAQNSPSDVIIATAVQTVRPAFTEHRHHLCAIPP